jgi:hypothetical protein
LRSQLLVVFVQGQAIVAPFNKTMENVLETISLMVRPRFQIELLNLLARAAAVGADLADCRFGRSYCWCPLF